MVTVNWPPGLTHVEGKDLAALGAVTVTRVSPLTVAERPSWSRTIPENVYDPPAMALTTYVNSSPLSRVKVSVWPDCSTWSSMLLDT